MNKKDIESLANLARIRLTEEEKEKYAKDIEAVLAYVDKIKEVAVEDKNSDIGAVFNVFRDDTPREINTEEVEKIKNQFPEREGDFLKAKSIL